ncbi:MAG: aspartate ammonia-lyase [Bacteroidetes bacterium]|nr:aspartate ammonia-lyase [Bacteroidota bacterium]
MQKNLTDSVKHDFIADIELFQDLTPEQKDIVIERFETLRVAKGDLLFAENSERESLYIVFDGEIELIKRTPFGMEKRISIFSRFDFIGEGVLMDKSPHATSARAILDCTVFAISRDHLEALFEEHGNIGIKVISRVAHVISRRMRMITTHVANIAVQYDSGRTRMEHDLLGDRRVPAERFYGIQTMRAMENFNISGVPLSFYPTLLEGLAMVKMAAAKANYDLGLLSKPITDAIIQACTDIINGRLHTHFVVDMMQGGAGTSTNMNANEVIANRALEILGYEKGNYRIVHPNNHINLSQSTNDAYPTAVKLALLRGNAAFIEVLERLITSMRVKAVEFANVLKMGRTQLQDAVPMTLGQTFEAWAVTLEEEVERINDNVKLFLEINMGATAIGTGLNAPKGYGDKVVVHLRDISGMEVRMARNLVEATQDTGAFIMYSSAVKRLAVKLSKICNDLRLLSSGPRAGINEINLPPMQPGSSIMPGKVNPVIPEVVNQIAFKVIGNDLTVTMAVEAGQLELNVFEPVIVQSLFESVEMLKNGMETLNHRCIQDITANAEHSRRLVEGSIGLVTALNPVLGYEVCTTLAKEALESGRGVYDLVLEKKLLTREEVDRLLAPENMIG